MRFCTSIHCMDGRIQESTIKYLKDTYGITYVDTITEPGPCKILADDTNKMLVDSILNRVNVSVNKHGSKLIAISGHYDCAGNPCGEQGQSRRILEKPLPEIRHHRIVDRQRMGSTQNLTTCLADRKSGGERQNDA